MPTTWRAKTKLLFTLDDPFYMGFPFWASRYTRPYHPEVKAASRRIPMSTHALWVYQSKLPVDFSLSSQCRPTMLEARRDPSATERPQDDRGTLHCWIQKYFQSAPPRSNVSLNNSVSSEIIPSTPNSAARSMCFCSFTVQVTTNLLAA